MADSRWKVTTRQAGTPDAAGRALVLPGVRYTKDHPLLFWASEVLVAAGWHVTAAQWRTKRADDPVEFVEAFVQNYSEGGYVPTRARKRLTDAIARAEGEDGGTRS